MYSYSMWFRVVGSYSGLSACLSDYTGRVARIKEVRWNDGPVLDMSLWRSTYNTEILTASFHPYSLLRNSPVLPADAVFHQLSYWEVTNTKLKIITASLRKLSVYLHYNISLGMNKVPFNLISDFLTCSTLFVANEHVCDSYWNC